jgi:hypothetical protein
LKRHAIGERLSIPCRETRPGNGHYTQNIFFFQKLKTQEWALGGHAASKVAPKKSTLENMKNLKSCLERLVKKKVKKMKTWRDFMED